jgi:hypothetical protein
MEGCLLKRAAHPLGAISPLLGMLNSRCWHRRWFVADAAAGTLTYYANEAATHTPLNTLALTPECVVVRVPGHAPRQHQFELQLRGAVNAGSAVLFACADTDEEAAAWVSFIQTIISRGAAPAGDGPGADAAPAEAAASTASPQASEAATATHSIGNGNGGADHVAVPILAWTANGDAADGGGDGGGASPSREDGHTRRAQAYAPTSDVDAQAQKPPVALPLPPAALAATRITAMQKDIMDEAAEAALLRAAAAQAPAEQMGASLQLVRLPLCYPENLAAWASARQIAVNFAMSYVQRMQLYTALFAVVVAVCIGILFFSATRHNDALAATCVVISSVAFGQLVFTTLLAAQVLHGTLVNRLASQHRIRLGRVDALLTNLLVSAGPGLPEPLQLLQLAAGGAAPAPPSRRAVADSFAKALRTQLSQARDVARGILLDMAGELPPASVLYVHASPAMLSTLWSVSISGIIAAYNSVSQRLE